MERAEPFHTLENAVYMSMHNDLSFIIDMRLSLYEHQSTRNPNLPLRFLFYLARLYSNMVKDKNLYGRQPIPLPAPRFMVFYNGEEECPEREMLRLSDAYQVKEEEPRLDLAVVVLNINPGNNKELLDDCQILADYSTYSDRVRTYAKDMELRDAVERAVTECIEEGILEGFL